ncbi:PmoA family protein [Streptomyces sp. E11-3]|uniref:DUF6807 domain-containing protein n=1 Tax=Streptomyces sp. E11-3 TaxID=3110112 RepID=UPI00397F1B92
MTDTLVLRLDGRPVGRYVYRSALATDHAPRPYLHPVTTLGGTAVTELMPDDHPHHLGVGVAVPDVEGRNFWGGRTFVRDRGSVALDNHGAQRHQGFPMREPDAFVEDLYWTAGGTRLLHERRTLVARELAGQAWALDFTFALGNTTDAPLSIGSPATNGRPGAAYGGFFWRAPKEKEPPAVFTAHTEGETAVHESTADWVAFAGDGWTLVFAGADEATRRDPWFVRAAEYPGVGSSLAHARRTAIEAGATLTRRIVTVVADGRLDRGQAADLVRQAVRDE